MANIKWLDVFEVGIPFIDEDHKRLIGLLQDIESAHAAADIRACRAAVGDFLEAVKAHFQREEKYLQIISFPRFAAHAKDHRSLTNQVIELLATMQPDPESGEEPDLEAGLIDDTLHLLLEDVIRADAEFKSLRA